MNPPVKPRQWQCFIAVAELLNFRAAAERLFMSQPPLSRQIRQLETRLGARLFERNRQGVSLTPAGEHWLIEARAQLASQQALLAQQRLQQRGAAIHLGMTPSLDPAPFLPAQQRLAVLTGLPIQHRSASSLSLIRAVARGALDAAWIGLPADTGELAVLPWQQDPLVVALPAAHPLAAAPRLSLAQLCGEPVFWFERQRHPHYFDFSRAVFQRHGFAPQWLPEAEVHHLLLAEIAAGRGIGLIARTLAVMQREGVVYRPLAEGEELAIGIGLVYPAEGRLAAQPDWLQALASSRP